MLNIDTISQKDAIIKAMVSDLAWKLKEIIFPASALTELISTGMAYDGSSFKWINSINHSDSILIGVPESIVKCPEEVQDTEKEEYRIICNIHTTDKKSHPNCARGRLLSLQKELSTKRDNGILYTWAEPEAFFVDKQEDLWKNLGGNTNYFNPRDPKSFVIAEIANYLEEMWFQVERAHAEVGDAQFEINRRFDKAERTADKIQIYKLLAHKVARQHGFDVTFLPKPFPSRNGSGMHFHLSVQNDSHNLFFDANKTENKNFSDKSLQFLQGILLHSRAIAAIGNCTESSYARLVPGFEAPCVIAAGEFNRSVSCRIPAIADPKALEKWIRTEIRFPDSLANPYLLSCAFIGAWLDGIVKNLTFSGFTDQNFYAMDLQSITKQGFELLPRNLWEAYQEFINNETFQKSLWTDICNSFSKIILEEIDSCQPYSNTESMRRHYFS